MSEKWRATHFSSKYDVSVCGKIRNKMTGERYIHESYAYSTESGFYKKNIKSPIVYTYREWIEKFLSTLFFSPFIKLNV